MRTTLYIFLVVLAVATSGADELVSQLSSSIEFQSSEIQPEIEPAPKRKKRQANETKAGTVTSELDFESDPTSDPFSIVRWTQFKIKAKHIQEALLNLTSTPNTAALHELSTFFEPLDEQLLDSIPYTKVNPAVGLSTKALLNTLALSKPTSNRDQTRLKWVEVNALAITVHYVYERLMEILKNGGDLTDVKDALEIEYPSWLQEKNTVEPDTYTLLNVNSLTDRIHFQMDSISEKFHLLRGLERLLRIKLIQLNPENTKLNLYCYGNNDYIVVHTVPDLLTDAALFLITADMKYFVIQAMQLAYALNSTTADPAAKDTLLKDFEAARANMSARIDKKIKLGTDVEIPQPELAFGPTIFPCDPPPEVQENGTLCLSSPLSPNVHIVDNVVMLMDGNQPAKIDNTSRYPMYENGTFIPGIEVYRRFKGADGTHYVSTPSFVLRADGDKVIDGNGTHIDGATIEYLYYPYTDLPRSNEIPQFSASEWGRFHCDLTVNSSTPRVAKDPPFGEPATGPESPTPVKDGYEDGRKPNFDAAQFFLAYSGYLEAEMVLSAEHSCVGTCLDYNTNAASGSRTCSSKTDKRCDLFRKSHCDDDVNCLSRSKCKTKARRCIRTAPSVEFCETTNEGKEGRIYDWLRLSTGKVIMAVDQSNLAPSTDGAASKEIASVDGPSPPCANKTLKTHEYWAMGYGVIMTAPEYCEVCLCVCDEPLAPEGYHHFGLAAIESSLSEGFVVTAIKFEQNGNTMQMNVEEGKWIGNGHVDVESLRWLELPEVDKLAHDGLGARLGEDGFQKMNLDMVYTRPNEVLTGIRLVNENGTLRMEIQGTETDAAGNLAKTPGPWKGSNPVKRTRIDLSDATSSLKQFGPSQPMNEVTSSSQYVKFDASSLEKDAGQAVIPFFDLQPTHHHSPIMQRKALQGAGITFKARHGFGGFLVPTATLYKKFY